MKCSKCRAKLKNQGIFCPNCGTLTITHKFGHFMLMIRKYMNQHTIPILMINGKEKYCYGIDNFNYNIDGELMKIIIGTWISGKGHNEYQINRDGYMIAKAIKLLLALTILIAERSINKIM